MYECIYTTCRENYYIYLNVSVGLFGLVFWFSLTSLFDDAYKAL